MTSLQRAKDTELQISRKLAQDAPDQALECCIEAVEVYMQARKESSNAEQKKSLAKKCRDLMKWGTELKVLKKQKEDSQAAVENASTHADTITTAMDTITTSATHLSVDDVRSTRRSNAPSPEPSKVSQILTPLTPPISKRPLSKRELKIVLTSAKLPPHIFPPWSDSPAESEFALSNDDALFLDKGGLLPLSDIQQVNLEQWKRVHEIWKGRETMTVKLDDEEKPLDLSQDVITDCSIVASLCAALEREQRGLGKIITDKIWPQRDGCPVISPNGKYVLKLWFNGCYRKVVIDDLLPTPQEDSSHTLYVTVNNCAPYLPPCLLEKAYLKAMGGYDFPGSNSGTDLMCFTGWIPEHLFLQSHNSEHNLEVVDQERLWERVYKAWGFGDVLVTLGTGDLKKWDGAGLVGEHDYAVLGMKEFTNKKGAVEKWWLVKNPWKEGGIWTGYRRKKRILYPDEDSESNSSDESDDNDSDESDGLSSLSDDDFDNPDMKNKSQNWERYTPAALPAPTSKSTFWIDLPSVYRYFESIYLNWNPALWKFRYDWHFSWDQTLSSTEALSSTSYQDLWSVTGCFWANPQYQIGNPSNSEIEVWVLVSRHLVSSAGSSPSHRIGWVRSGHISLYLFTAGGNRVYQTSGFLKRGPYVDSPQTLLRFKIPPKTTYTTVVSSQFLLPEDSSHPFSISAFSRTPIDFQPANDLYPHTLSFRGSWTTLTAGGNRESSEYEVNPMYKLTVTDTSADLIIGLSVSDANIYIHVALLHSNGGQRVYTVTRGQIIVDSGEYIRHHTICRASAVPRGSYTMVVSTYKPNQMANFRLTVGSSRAGNSLAVIRNEDAGLYKRVLRAKWPVASKKALYCLQVTRLSKAKIKCVHSNRGFVRVGIWEQSTNQWTAGGWDEDDNAGFVEGKERLDEVDLRPDREVGATWIIIERMGSENAPGEAGFELTVLSDNVVEIVNE